VYIYIYKLGSFGQYSEQVLPVKKTNHRPFYFF